MAWGVQMSYVENNERGAERWQLVLLRVNQVGLATRIHLISLMNITPDYHWQLSYPHFHV